MGWTFTFDPLDITELHSAEDFAVTYRQALKMRLGFCGQRGCGFLHWFRHTDKGPDSARPEAIYAFLRRAKVCVA